MNNYYSKLNLDINIDIDFEQYKTSIVQARVPNSIIDDAAHATLLKEFNIQIQWLEMFYLKPFAKHQIHVDGHELNDKAKLNYIAGGQGSNMIWYRPNNVNNITSGISMANTKYLRIPDKDAIEAERQELHHFNIVNVGCLHTVENADKDRYCLSIALNDATTAERLTYPELQERFKLFIITV